MPARRVAGLTREAPGQPGYIREGQQTPSSSSPAELVLEARARAAALEGLRASADSPTYYRSVANNHAVQYYEFRHRSPHAFHLRRDPPRLVDWVPAFSHRLTFGAQLPLDDLPRNRRAVSRLSVAEPSCSCAGGSSR